MPIVNMIILMSGPLIAMITLVSLRKMGWHLVAQTVNKKDQILIPLIIFSALSVNLYVNSSLQIHETQGTIENVMMQMFSDNIYIVASYTFLFLVLPTCIMIWFMIKKHYIKRDLAPSLTAIHMIVILSMIRLLNYYWLDLDDAVVAWLVCYIICVTRGMLEHGKTKKKIVLVIVALAVLFSVVFAGNVDLLNITFLGTILTVENLILAILQRKLLIFRNIIRYAIIVAVVLLSASLNMFIFI